MRPCPVHQLLVALLLIAALGSCQCQAEGGRRKVVIPSRLKLAALYDPSGRLRLWEEVQQSYRAGDADTVNWVRRTVQSAANWARRPDSYYLGLFRPDSPFGSSTLCCPHHPEMSGWVPFNWDPDEPWRLTCPLCEKEGRKPAYYPNELYPDSGAGCRPTGEVWRQTHDAAWEAKYKIPADHWDKHTHGHIDSFAFFFLGHCQWRICFELNWRHDILGTLTEGYLFASRLYPEGSPERQAAALYAHKAKLIMVTLSRAIMGDDYLRQVVGKSPEQFAAATAGLALDPDGRPLPARAFPGYEVKDNISDHSAGDPEHPLGNLAVSWWNNALTRFPGSASSWCDAWLGSYAMIQASFTPPEREAGLDAMVERLLASDPGDAQRLAAGATVKPGVIDEGMDPYTVDLKGNLAGSAALAALNTGLMLDNPEIVRTAVKAVHAYLRSYFTTDGLGYETSPHYTQVALSNLAGPLDLIATLPPAGFSAADPFWEAGSGRLQPYRDAALQQAAYSPLLSVLPDGRCAPWCDSWVTESPGLESMAKQADRTGGVPERYRPFLDISKNADGYFSLKLREDQPLPSYVLDANGLAVMRYGRGKAATFVSVDWSRATGHSHNGPFNLLLYAAGHELLYDQGYLNNVTPTQAWMDCAESHNTALVRTANGDTTPCVNWRGGKHFFADTPEVKAVEAAEDDAAKLHQGLPAEQQVLYRRTVTTLALPGSDEAYVVDLFRLQGGAWHEYYLHSLGDALTLDGANLSPADPAATLYDLSGFTYRASTGAKVIRDVRRGQAEGALTACWRHLVDYRTVPPETDDRAATFAHFLPAAGTEVFTGTGPGQRYIDARDVQTRTNLLTLRRRAEAYRESPDLFAVAVAGSRDGSDPVRGFRALQVQEGARGAVGVCVEHRAGVDYVLSALDAAAPVRFIDPVTKREFTLQGRLAVVRYPTGGKREELRLEAQELQATEAG